jgi:hypothetical protein
LNLCKDCRLPVVNKGDIVNLTGPICHCTRIMTPTTRTSAEEKAEAYVRDEICFNGLEYSPTGAVSKDCVQSYLAGHAEGMRDALSSPEIKALIETVRLNAGNIHYPQKLIEALQRFQEAKDKT